MGWPISFNNRNNFSKLAVIELKFEQIKQIKDSQV